MEITQKETLCFRFDKSDIPKMVVIVAQTEIEARGILANYAIDHPDLRPLCFVKAEKMVMFYGGENPQTMFIVENQDYQVKYDMSDLSERNFSNYSLYKDIDFKKFISGDDTVR